jgi:hypothetical protein
VQTPELFDNAPDGGGAATHRRARRPPAEGIWGAGDTIVWVSALVLALSVCMDWYTGTSAGVDVSVIGWHTGLYGKLVFFIAVVILAIVVLRRFGIELPPSVPESFVILALGSLATVFVLIRVIWIPESVLPADGRGIGIWISLLSSLGVIAGGLLRAAEEI